jgi:hypothetical protein
LSPRVYREFGSQESTLTEVLLRWFDSRPDWVKMAIICLIGCAVPLAVVMLLVFLGKA